jgi:uncharacterized protein YdcH (DUF465 family)
MSHLPHSLAEEFPRDAERIRALSLSNAHFHKLEARYHEVNRAIHRAEANIEPIGDAVEVEMRRERMRLKDEIARMLAAQPA